MKTLLMLAVLLLILFAPSLVLATLLAVLQQPVTIAFVVGVIARPAIARRLRGWVA